MLVETQLPVHHLLIMKLKLNVAARRNVDLCLEGLHILGICPVVQKHVRFCESVGTFHVGVTAGPVPDDAGRLALGSGLGVQVPGHRLLLHRAHERDAVHIPAT